MVQHVRIWLQLARSAADTVSVSVARCAQCTLHTLLNRTVSGCDVQGCPLNLGSNVYMHTIDLSFVQYILDMMSDGVSTNESRNYANVTFKKKVVRLPMNWRWS
jgi:hypothetical protein